MSKTLNLVMVLHSHQPVGNFDHVIEDAYRQCYRPFLDAFSAFPSIPVTLHYSGCLLEWLENHHPDYFKLLKTGVSSGRIDMMGGGMQEPILTMLPQRDRHGQLTVMADYIHAHFGRKPHGMWLAERIWEQSLVTDIARAGYAACCLDDSHFKNAGYADADLTGGFIAEDQGNTIRVFPGSEKLRYLIPFAPVEEIIDYLKSRADDSGIATIVYADDGEKFGTWPHTHEHCYTHGWLKQFLSALKDNADWLHVITLKSACDLPPKGMAYLPDAAYREMGEWALPAIRLAELKRAFAELDDNAWFEKIKGQVRGGSWRNFRVKYPEALRLYAKMLHVSEQVRDAENGKIDSAAVQTAREELYRGQCNCPYWHGVFGGLYLPHLRAGVQSALIRAQNLIEQSGGEKRLIVDVHDFDRDGFDEVYISNSELGVYFSPNRGGRLTHFDVRRVTMNVLDTFSRRYEEYHDRVSIATVIEPDVPDEADDPAADSDETDGHGEEAETQSIHSAVLAKQAGLENLLHYDEGMRESLADHVFRYLPTPDALETAESRGHPAFLGATYSLAGPRRTKSGVSVTFSREADATGVCRAKINKTVRVKPGDAGFDVTYRVTNTGLADVDFWLGVEMNYALMAGNAYDRYYRHDGAVNAGQLDTIADFGVRKWIELRDEFNSLVLTLAFGRQPATVMVFPVRTVSQSEGGFESVYQSSAVFSFWRIQLAPGHSQTWSFRQEASPCH